MEATTADRRIGKRLKTARDAKNWSQAELAKRLGEKKIPAYASTVAKIEAGNRPIRAAELAVLADLLGVSTDSLLGRNRQPDADRAQAALEVADTLTRAAAAAAEHSEAVARLTLELLQSTDKLPNHDALVDGCDEGRRRLAAASEALQAVGAIARGIVHDELKAAGLE